MAQRVGCLMHMHEDLSSDLKHPCKNLGVTAGEHWSPSTREVEMGRCRWLGAQSGLATWCPPPNKLRTIEDT